MAELILANEGNEFSPPVKSISLGSDKNRKGTRLVHFGSLLAYLNAKLERRTQL